MKLGQSIVNSTGCSDRMGSRVSGVSLFAVLESFGSVGEGWFVTQTRPIVDQTNRCDTTRGNIGRQVFSLLDGISSSTDSPCGYVVQWRNVLGLHELESTHEFTVSEKPSDYEAQMARRQQEVRGESNDSATKPKKLMVVQ